MAKTWKTDERLKSYLDTNQLAREQLCLAVLALDRRFTAVKPRQPRGGPDGGRDIEALFQRETPAFGAVGFKNQAQDSEAMRKEVRQKFTADLARALDAMGDLQVFVFMTNVNMTVTDEDEMRLEARERGVQHCEVIDRERLRISLDSPDGLAIRFQLLGLSLSQAEQASFFARWGEDINSLISTGIQSLEHKLDRMLFLQEAENILQDMYVRFHLDREYPASEIGHFRAFTLMYLKEQKAGVVAIRFGATDRIGRYADEPLVETGETPGIGRGICGIAWEGSFKVDPPRAPEDLNLTFNAVVSSARVGPKSMSSIWTEYNHDDHLLRWRPRLRLRDLDQCQYVFFLNRRLAERVVGVDVHADSYRLATLRELAIRECTDTELLPPRFTAAELEDGWVTLGPKGYSSFQILFEETSPQRVFVPVRVKS